MWLIFRILINLYHKLYRVLYYPFFQLRKRAFGLIVIGMIIYVVIQFNSATDGPNQTDHIAPLIQHVEQFEDGNSKFANDLLPQMHPDELRYYSQIYFWVMDNQPSDQPHQWSYNNIYGTLTPGELFNNNYGHRCRRFAELLKVHSTQQRLDGIACEQPKGGGWCKLRKSYTPICGLTPETGFGGWLNKMKRNLF